MTILILKLSFRLPILDGDVPGSIFHNSYNSLEHLDTLLTPTLAINSYANSDTFNTRRLVS